MEIEIRWSPEAHRGLQNTIDYLEYKWTEQEIIKFNENLVAFIERIKKNPYLYPATLTNTSLRKGLIDKNNFIIYEYVKDDQVIQLVTLKSTRQKPL